MYHKVLVEEIFEVIRVVRVFPLKPLRVSKQQKQILLNGAYKPTNIILNLTSYEF